MSQRVAWLVVLVVGMFMGSVTLPAAQESEEPSEALATSDTITSPSAPSGADATPASTEASPASAEEKTEEPPRLSMEFQDVPLKDVLKTFSQQSGINVIATSDVSAKPVTIYLEDVTVLDALDQILRSTNLTYERPANSDIYLVKPIETGGGPATITRVYRLRYARVSKSVLAQAVSSFSSVTPFEASAGVGTVSSSSSSSSGGSSSGTSTGGAGGGAARGGTGGGGEDVGIDEVIKKLITDNGKIVVDSRTNSLVVTDVPENFPRIEATLTALDVRTKQIMVDAEVIETTLTKAKSLGFEWGGSTGTVVTLTPGTRKTGFPFNAFGGGITPHGSTPFSASSLDASSFAGVLKALESDVDTKILARPKVLTLDNESAVIRLTSDQAIGFQTASQTQTGTNTTTPERFTTGVILSVTPQINEGGDVTMLVEPVVTKTTKSSVTPPSTSGTIVDPKTRSARSIVRIKSGGTLVIGGLIDRSDSTTVRKVPILGDIPLVGEAFKSNVIDNSASELIVFITPRILDEAPATQAASTAQGLAQAREQEAPAGRESEMERSLNILEQSKL